jgi:predicted transcriptional regulator
MEAHKTFAKWLKKNGVNQAKVAKLMRVSPPCVHDWLHQKRQPGPAYRDAIQTWTDGAVMADAWLTKEELENLQFLRSIQPFEDVHESK